ncbi:MAG: hypothetical protein LLG13_09700 [Bacteroidales bacterium]|nr:hypothetical protein [Bacteroidales bacterium]
MSIKHQFSRDIRILIILLISTIAISCSSCFRNHIIIENKNFKYEIDKDGKNLLFTDKTTGTDYLKTDTLSYCAVLTSDGKQYNVTDVSLNGGLLKLGFSNAGVTAEVRITKSKDHIVFKVENVNGPVESLTFINVPLKLEGMPYEPFAACALSMNLYTRVRQLPALQTQLWATCYKRFGITGAEVTLIGVPQKQILPVIREVMENAKDIPHSDKGGAWALLQKKGYGSYLMNFGTLTQETVDEWITMCKNLGFNQIDNHGGGNFFTFGDFELNAEKWPGGWSDFKIINKRLHDAGISSIFHTYAFFIDKNSKLVTPVPSHDLGYFDSFTLSAPIDKNDTEITVNESTGSISMITGFFVRNSITLRIGDELIQYSNVTDKPPYKFTGCKRGVNGTSAANHGLNEKAYHLREMFGRFVPGPDTELFKEIASRTSEIVNKCGFDGIYFDAIDGSDILGGEENFWYYGTKFIFEVAKNLERPVGMEMSSMSHLWWHYRSRWQAWDRPVRGYKRFIDIHSTGIKSPGIFLPDVIKSNEYEHGLWRGNSKHIEKYAQMENGGLFLPLHFGWWGNQIWNPPQVEPTFPDDIEYLCCKMIGNNAGLSMLGGVDKKTLDDNPLYGRLIPIIRQYEELRHKNYFNDTVRSLLRQPGKEFTLFQEEDGKWNFKPVAYQKHKVTGNHDQPAKWTVNNEFNSQPVKLRIEALMSVKPYNSTDNVVLTDFSAPLDFVSGGNAKGVSGEIDRSGGKIISGENGGLFSAMSQGNSPREGSWIKIEKNFDPLLDLSKNQALGVWINGDGNGELLNLRLESPKHLSHGARGDHFVKIDFKGWKYFELVEIESSEFTNYIWPDSGFYVYDSYRHTVQFNSIDKLQLWYNNLPAGKNVSCTIGPVKALPLVPATIINPSISIGTDKIIFPVKMEPGMYIELKSLTDCKLYGPRGELIKEITVEGNNPVLSKGNNEINFSCDKKGGINSRVQVTVISEGQPL